MIRQPRAEKRNHDLKIEVKSNLGFFGRIVFTIPTRDTCNHSAVRTVCFPFACLETGKEQTKLTAQLAVCIVTHTACFTLLYWYLFPMDERRRCTELK